MTVLVFYHNVSAFSNVLVWTGERCENGSVHESFEEFSVRKLTIENTSFQKRINVDGA